MRLSESKLKNILKNGHCFVIDEQITGLAKNKGRVASGKPVIDGHKFDSRAEALIYSEFKIDPDVEILKLQPCFILLTPFQRDNGIKCRGISYTADFRILERGVEWIVEVKSTGTLKANSKSYPMRRKLFLNKFRDLRFREIIFNGKKREIREY